jgi:hypothetical protein
MSDIENSEPVIRAIAADAVALIHAGVTIRSDTSTEPTAVGGTALARLARLLEVQLATPRPDDEVYALTARAVIETWLSGHAAVLLGDAGLDLLADREAGALTLEELARRLDVAMYGESEKPKAFRRHLASFFDEIDVGGTEGTRTWLARYRDSRDPRQITVAPSMTETPIDFIRVCLWVTLFLSHDYFAAVDDAVNAKAARALFDRLRAATDDFYYARRRAEG